MSNIFDLSQNKLIIVVALAPEAKSIRSMGDWYRLEHIPGAPICYQREDKPMVMVVTGSGKVASALATAWILEKHTDQNCWPNIMNVGLAGAAQASMGSLWWIHKVIDAGSAKNWYPQQATKQNMQTSPLMTFDRVQSTYPPKDLVDMEASGFMQAACQWSTIEQIAIVKCISDNQKQSGEGLKPKDVVLILNQQRELLEALFDESIHNAAKHVKTSIANLMLDPWYQRWHFTQTQKIQLRKHLQALALFIPGEEAMFLEACAACHSAKEVLACLEAIRQETHGQLFHV